MALSKSGGVTKDVSTCKWSVCFLPSNLAYVSCLYAWLIPFQILFFLKSWVREATMLHGKRVKIWKLFISIIINSYTIVQPIFNLYQSKGSGLSDLNGINILKIDCEMHKL